LKAGCLPPRKWLQPHMRTSSVFLKWLTGWAGARCGHWRTTATAGCTCPSPEDRGTAWAGPAPTRATPSAGLPRLAGVPGSPPTTRENHNTMGTVPDEIRKKRCPWIGYMCCPTTSGTVPVTFTYQEVGRLTVAIRKAVTPRSERAGPSSGKGRAGQ